MNDGATATYDGTASNPSGGTLVFDDTVGASDQTPNLAISQVNLRGPILSDSQRNLSNLSGALNVGTGVQIGATPCFSAGTRILTDRGEVAVENLRAGARVCVVLGDATREIAWIGHRHVDCRHHPKPRQVWPVRIAAGAFGSGRPCRDLFLSPDHAIYMLGVLIPIKHLINGNSIVQARIDRIT